MFYIIIQNSSGDAIDFDIIFKLSFASTILSAAYALTSQLKLGPCQIMPRDKFGLTFVLVFICNLLGLMGKGLLLKVLADYMRLSGFPNFYAPIMLIVTSILPPMTFVSKLPIDYYQSLFFIKKSSKNVVSIQISAILEPWNESRLQKSPYNCQRLPFYNYVASIFHLDLWLNRKRVLLPNQSSEDWTLFSKFIP